MKKLIKILTRWVGLILALNKHSKILGVDFDPNNDMKLKELPDGDVRVKYKGQNMEFDSYVDEIEERTHKHQQGKSITHIGLFGGFGKGTLNNKT